MDSKVQLDYSIPATVFHLFPKHPFELRTKIFRAAAPKSRLIKVDPDFYGKPGLDWAVRNILCVSQEARRETLRRYNLQFLISESKLGVPFDAKSDAIMLHTSCVRYSPPATIAGFDQEVTDAIEHVVINANPVEHSFWPNAFTTLLDVVLKFPSLQRLTVLLNWPVESPTEPEWQHQTLIFPRFDFSDTFSRGLLTDTSSSAFHSTSWAVDQSIIGLDSSAYLTDHAYTRMEEDSRMLFPPKRRDAIAYIVRCFSRVMTNLCGQNPGLVLPVIDLKELTFYTDPQSRVAREDGW